MGDLIDRWAGVLHRLLSPVGMVVLGKDRLKALLGEIDRLHAALEHERRKTAELEASAPSPAPAIEEAPTPYVKKLEAKIEALREERARLIRNNKLAHGKLRWHWATYPASAREWEELGERADPAAARRMSLRDRLVDMIAEPEFPAGDRRVTVVVTSCDRHDLLERTLESFFRANSCPVDKVIVVEDGDTPAPLALRARFAAQPMEWMSTGGRVGQIRAIDSAYGRVATPYIFHMEDDWEFLHAGFVEESLEILEAEPMCLQVWLRGRAGPYPHELEPGDRITAGVRWRRAARSKTSVWHGFSFNPALKRLRDYRLIGAYAGHVETQLGQGGLAEGQLSDLYASLGFFAASLWTHDGEDSVRHLGDERHVT